MTVIRYSALAAGVIMMIVIAMYHYKNNKFGAGTVLLIFLWLMLPFYLQFFLTGSTENILRVLLPSIVLIVVYVISIKEYFNSDHATADLVLISTPLFGFAAIGVGYLLLFFIGLFRDVK